MTNETNLAVSYLISMSASASPPFTRKDKGLFVSPAPDNRRALYLIVDDHWCVGVGVSISVEGCVDVCTSPSMMSSGHSYEWRDLDTYP
jgi:hypothetical protein